MNDIRFRTVMAALFAAALGVIGTALALPASAQTIGGQDISVTGTVAADVTYDDRRSTSCSLPFDGYARVDVERRQNRITAGPPACAVAGRLDLTVSWLTPTTAQVTGSITVERQECRFIPVVGVTMPCEWTGLLTTPIDVLVRRGSGTDVERTWSAHVSDPGATYGVTVDLRVSVG